MAAGFEAIWFHHEHVLCAVSEVLGSFAFFFFFSCLAAGKGGSKGCGVWGPAGALSEYCICMGDRRMGPGYIFSLFPYLDMSWGLYPCVSWCAIWHCILRVCFLLDGHSASGGAEGVALRAVLGDILSYDRVWIWTWSRRGRRCFCLRDWYFCYDDDI